MTRPAVEALPGWERSPHRTRLSRMVYAAGFGRDSSSEAGSRREIWPSQPRPLPRSCTEIRWQPWVLDQLDRG